MLVNGGAGDAGAPGDRRDGRAFEPLPGHDLEGRLENPVSQDIPPEGWALGSSRPGGSRAD
jgi:hypothetical protein